MVNGKQLIKNLNGIYETLENIVHENSILSQTKTKKNIETSHSGI